MDYDFLHSCFPNYTKEMYDGNSPCGESHALVNGGFSDRWSCKYGTAETDGDMIISASITISPKITLFICGDLLWITDIRYSGKHDVWEYTSDGKTRIILIQEKHLHKLEEEKIEQILNTKFDGKLWGLIQKRAIELYKGGIL